jgi:hypothetical protein
VGREDPIRWAMADNVLAYERRSEAERERRREYFRARHRFDLSLYGAYREWPLTAEGRAKRPAPAEGPVKLYGEWGYERLVLDEHASPRKSLAPDDLPDTEFVS